MDVNGKLRTMRIHARYMRGNQMALGTGLVVPQELALPLQFSVGLSQWIGRRITVVPRNPDGTVYDLTDATGTVINLQGSTEMPWEVATAGTPVMVSHDATGAVLDLTPTVINNFCSTGNQSCPYSIVATDGTTSRVIAKGTVAFSTAG